MAYKTDQKTTVTRRVRRRSVVVPPTPEPISLRPAVPELAVSHQTSQRTNLIFQVLLASATCLALVAAVASLNPRVGAPSTSPDAPPPAVFVQGD